MQGGRKLGGQGGRRSLFCSGSDVAKPSPLFETTSTDQYEVQHPFWDENTYFLAYLCLACVDDADDDDDDYDDYDDDDDDDDDDYEDDGSM